MKIIFWTMISFIWSPFEVLHMILTQKISKIGCYIADKFNSSI